MSSRFISEAEVDAIRKKKQEEWEKKRSADDPVVRPEEPEEYKSLAERLKENADKKQAEFEEKFALKNMIYTGMDEDEFEHVESLAKAEHERALERQKREGEALEEFRKKARKAPPTENEHAPVVRVAAQARRGKEGKSALTGLKAAIRKKPSGDECGGGGAAVDPEGAGGGATSKGASPASKGKAPATTAGGAPAAAAAAAPAGGLGGLVAYGSSSDDDDDDTDS